MEYWYNQQLRQYRLQVIRAFSNFSVSMGINSDGTPKLRRVPCRYGDPSRLAETITNANSENKLPTAPFISVYLTAMSLAPNRRHAPSLVSTQNVIEREYDGENSRYLGTQGNRSTVERYMAVPFDLTFNVDFWTSNLNQKEELIEQTQVLYNGMIDIQTSNNPLDWTAITTLEPTNITWSSRSIPIGTENPIDVCTVEYKVPIFINPPAKVKLQKIIQEIVTNIREGEYDPNTMEWTEQSLLSRVLTTPLDACIAIANAGENTWEISLQSPSGSTIDPQTLPTRVLGRKNPVLTPGTTFKFNGQAITIPNTSIDDLINLIRVRTVEPSLNAVFNLNQQIEFWNMTGGDIVLENVEGTPIQDLGFQPTIYKGGTLAWWRLLDKYGAVKPQSSFQENASQIRLLSTDDLDNRDSDIVGYIDFHPTNQNYLIWKGELSSWPGDQLPPITAVIDPQRTYPGSGLTEERFGQRYLLTNEIAFQSGAWGNVQAIPNVQALVVGRVSTNELVIEPVDQAQLSLNRSMQILFGSGITQTASVVQIVQLNALQYQVVLSGDSVAQIGDFVQVIYPVIANDIIEYNGSQWVLAFDSSSPLQTLVLNQYSQKWFLWTNQEWKAFPKSTYTQGLWRLSL